MDDGGIDSYPPPRRLRTAYAYLVQERYHDISRELNTRQPQIIIRRIGEIWRTLPPNQRERFTNLEQRDRARYEQAKLEWIRQQGGRAKGYMNRRRSQVGGPRKPASAYVLFKREMGETLRQEMPDATAKERQRESIRRWREMSDENRKKYVDKSSEDKVRYAREMHQLRQQERLREVAQQQQAEQPQGENQDAAPNPAQQPAAAAAAPAPAVANPVN